MNKIDDLLLENHSLFNIVDCIVLDDSLSTCKNIERIVCVENGSIEKCSNIIFINRSKNKIIKTKSKKIIYTFHECINRREDGKNSTQNYLSPSVVANLKLNPNTSCFWNRCTFCGINKKYKYISNHESIGLEKKIEYIQELISKGVKFFWFEDEAISPDYLDAFATLIIQNGLQFKWQARSRIDVAFTVELADKLFLAGLREIRFGLESACPRILSLMNKFPPEITLDTIENVVKMFTTAGIHVHFPMIVGYPTETSEERVETYLFLLMLREKYKAVTFNINILMLDIASDLYKNRIKYGICAIYFPCPQNQYLGNMVEFECDEKMESRMSIDFKRNECMRESLYPWMPSEALIKPNIFYRLSETIRNTLIWSCHLYRDISQKCANSYKKSGLLSIWREKDSFYLIYNWSTHRIYRFSPEDYNMFSKLKTLTQNEIEKSPFYCELLKAALLQPCQE